mmetsp:Transcript_24558/g.50559  ORF Transcript_24558/g.50559 Transcript_24558/m.50559 type:complete len:225 (-) Transcript_24558:1343-2017(-)
MKSIFPSQDQGLIFLVFDSNLLILRCNFFGSAITSLLGISRLLIFGKSGVFSQQGDLALQELHILGKSLHGVIHVSAAIEACKTLLQSLLLLPPPNETGNAQNHSDHQERSQHGEANSLLHEERRKSQQQQRNDEEHNNDVDGRNETRAASSTSEGSCSPERDATHDRDGVPDDNTRNVEEQVAQGYLEGIHIVRNHGSQETGDGGSDVGSESQWKHLLQLNHS